MSPLLRRRHSSPSRTPAPASNTSTMSSKTLTKMSNTSTLSANTPTSCNNIAPTTVNQGPTKPCLTSCVSVPALKSGSFSFRPRYVKNCYFCEHDDTAEDKVRLASLHYLGELSGRLSGGIVWEIIWGIVWEIIWGNCLGDYLGEIVWEII